MEGSIWSFFFLDGYRLFTMVSKWKVPNYQNSLKQAPKLTPNQTFKCTDLKSPKPQTFKAKQTILHRHTFDPKLPNSLQSSKTHIILKKLSIPPLKAPNIHQIPKYLKINTSSNWSKKKVSQSWNMEEFLHNIPNSKVISSSSTSFMYKEGHMVDYYATKKL